jgi:hypothetical protein
MSDVQITVGFRRKSGNHPPLVLIVFHILGNDTANKIQGRFFGIIAVYHEHLLFSIQVNKIAVLAVLCESGMKTGSIWSITHRCVYTGFHLKSNFAIMEPCVMASAHSPATVWRLKADRFY